MRITDTPSVVLDCQNELGESILWDDRNNRLWWTNIHAKEVWSWSPWQAQPARVYAMPQRVGAIIAVAAKSAV